MIIAMPGAKAPANELDIAGLADFLLLADAQLDEGFGVSWPRVTFRDGGGEVRIPIDVGYARLGSDKDQVQ